MVGRNVFVDPACALSPQAIETPETDFRAMRHWDERLVSSRRPYYSGLLALALLKTQLNTEPTSE